MSQLRILCFVIKNIYLIENYIFFQKYKNINGKNLLWNLIQVI